MPEELPRAEPPPSTLPPSSGRGRSFLLPRSRRLVTDTLYFSQKIPGQPLTRYGNIARLANLRKQAAVRIGWPVLFLRAYGLLSRETPPLRQTYMPWPLPYIYEHPVSSARMTIARDYRGEEWVFFLQVLEPENRTLIELQDLIRHAREAPIESITKFRQQLIFSRFPRFLRRIAWWVTLNVSARKRIARFGTFGVTTVSAAGAISIKPPSVYTTMLTFGPVSETGDVRLTIIYDHRVMDGMVIARCLARLEELLNTVVADELQAIG
ncbi:MAG: 2-oxo acid dehydrogenase subunit E2 [Planctomycetes bacterium]|nr:2-oxo acid dehydrogenase subunit E2 [Planctomycetota bacterium]